MGDDARAERLQALGMLASALAGQAVAVAGLSAGEPAWTDGQTIHVDAAAPARAKLEAIAVHASMIAAGSLDPEAVGSLVRHPRLAKRYLAVEGHRALVANAHLLPTVLASLGNRDIAARSDSPAASLEIAAGRAPLDDPGFGVIRAAKVMAACARVTKQDEQANAGHVPRKSGPKELEELDDGEVDDSDDPDLFTSPVGGGGFIGKWLKKMLSSARKTGSGGGPPGADAPTHRTNSGKRGAHAVSSLASTASEDVDDAEAAADGVRYPEWDAARKRYRPAWCTVREVEPEVKASATQAIDDAIGVRRPLSRLGMGLHRRHRQSQGDDIDIDAAVEARVEVRSGSVPDESVYLDSLRRRRDLSVLLLLDVSGSAAEPGTVGRTVHEQQRAAVANLTVALHDLGDRVCLYAYYSQGRSAVAMVPVKRFDDHLDAHIIRRLNSLEPGAYSRLGAAIRHGSSVLEARGGTSRRLLVVLSDGLAYDHGYERPYGAADARRALTEARRRGTGCVCLTIGAGTDVASLRRVFGSTAHATVARPDQLAGVIGPLFRSALRSAEVRRRVSA
ncbi:nitric oxide reductase activation protein NorD [Mycobacterium montefiorense]|uniref:NorD nitric oxide reductase activation protein n=1 Tax=Mycobacterium montefiorense TaxID=154654 RepID=A0AA37PVB6_9MYCO|nr:VWA domain-containing protein [Mycobacterium montefiorense]GBG39466.1 NorD nitric oxide reductase activation protein [Mycobacterium montefiorense]GKU36051.1 NorD nitric oxide reductase activation protein [Mycobacterium montefiorense]GKU41121.1 NorD nitric oxide reductase activation protein [Mycobacterium montefiorense]GKU44120.1 NorD nitric oxide reductase activation protein [Mycobacterium montefiorense]GKU52466.1 NorD nitric oxide reductase activation protein [Mycobacterium montefiorense]